MLLGLKRLAVFLSGLWVLFVALFTWGDNLGNWEATVFGVVMFGGGPLFVFWGLWWVVAGFLRKP